MIRALFTVLALLGLTWEASSDRDIAAERRQMVEEIKQMAAETAKETGTEGDGRGSASRVRAS